MLLSNMSKFRFILFSLVVMCFRSGVSQDTNRFIVRDLEIFNSFYNKLLEKYVDSIQSAKLMHAGMDAFCKLLDPYTVFTDSADILARRNAWKGVLYSGIGVNIIQRDSFVVITGISEGTPAYKTGLRIGDQLVKADSILLQGNSLSDVVSHLKGKDWTPLKLTVFRPVTGYMEFTLIREPIIAKSVRWYGLLDDSTGYIRCEQFLRNSYDTMLFAFKYLTRNVHFRRLILDFRDNIGGLVQDAVNSANIFLPKGRIICSLKSANNKGANYDYTALYDPVDTIIPIVILTNQNTISAGEIFCGAMQDYDRAVIIGARTFGKGYVQGTHSLAHGAELYVTSARYFTPSGRCIQTLDLTHRYIDGSVNLINDSLKKAFYTRNGRPVSSNGGIEPDVVLEPEKESNELINALINNYIIADFATIYRNSHENVPNIKTFKISEEDYKNFVKNAKLKLKPIRLRQEEVLSNLLKECVASKQSRLYRSLKKSLNRAVQEKYCLFKDSKNGITSAVEKAIIIRYFHYSGEIRYNFFHSVPFKKALSILNHNLIYLNILHQVQ